MLAFLFQHSSAYNQDAHVYFGITICCIIDLIFFFGKKHGVKALLRILQYDRQILYIHISDP